MISGNGYGLKLLVLHLSGERNLLLEALPSSAFSKKEFTILVVSIYFLLDSFLVDTLEF